MSTRATTGADYAAVKLELDAIDAKIRPLDEELVRLKHAFSHTLDRVEAAECEVRSADIQEERLPLWRHRQQVARRFAVLQAVEDERTRRTETAKRARRDIERAETKLKILDIANGELLDLMTVLVPGRRVHAAPSEASAFKPLMQLVFGRLRDSYLRSGVEADLHRARRELAEAEGYDR